MDEIAKNNKLENLIYEIRGKQVMLDRDLARLYQCNNGTKEINQNVKRNIKKFPERYMFQLTKEEYNNLWSQTVTAKKEEFVNLKLQFVPSSKMSRTLPYAFTEQGVAMLATILKTSVAAQVSIQIMDAFVEMRKYISSNLIEQKYVNNLVFKHEEEIRLLQKSFETLSIKEKNNHIFFEGQIYDAYSLMLDIFNTSMSKIIIIDNYIDKNILDILSKTNKQIILITNKYNNEDYKKYKTQYDNVILKINNSFHDRFIIIDDKTLYHSGASFKDLGKKCFSITKIEDLNILENLLKEL